MVNLWLMTNMLKKHQYYELRNYELFRTSNLHEWYERHVIEPTLAALEEFQESGSVTTDGHCHESSILRKQVQSYACRMLCEITARHNGEESDDQSMDNACFAWSVVTALYPAEQHVDRTISYPHYTSVLNLQDIQFPMTLKDITKFERLNKVSNFSVRVSIN